MKIVIAGIGKLGKYLTNLLVKEDNEITLVDINFSGKESLINNEDVNYVEGNALDSNILIEAGISDADLLISVMKSDSENMMCSLIGKKLGAKHTIARIRTPEYFNSVNIIRDMLGLSMVINPEALAAAQIAQALSIPSALDATSFFKGKMEVISLRIKENSKLNEMSIEELSKKINNKIIVCAIERADTVIIPSGDTKLLVGDKIHITGKRKDINIFLKYAQLISRKTKKVIIAGGSSIAVYLSQILIDMGMHVKIIERDEQRCKFLSERIPNSLIIHGDISNQNILYEEGIKECDAFVSLTSLDEENIVYSMFASSLCVPKVITKVNHINLDGIIKKANIDTVIASHKVAANHVVQYIRAVENSRRSSCEAIYKFDDDVFEIIEFKVKEDFKGLNTKIKNLNIKDNLLISAIQRGKNIIYPNGEEEIKLKDSILIIAKNGTLRNLNDLVK